MVPWIIQVKSKDIGNISIVSAVHSQVLVVTPALEEYVGLMPQIQEIVEYSVDNSVAKVQVEQDTAANERDGRTAKKHNRCRHQIR